MEWTIQPHEDGSGDWVVTAIDFAGDGEIFTTIFSGSSSKERAQEYFAWKQKNEN